MHLSQLLKAPIRKALAFFGYRLSRIPVETPAITPETPPPASSCPPSPPPPPLSREAELVAVFEKTYGRTAVERKEFLNIGAGAFRHPCWRNVDFYSEHYRHDVIGNMDIEWDMSLGTPLPVPDASIHIVYTSHTIEHTMTEHAQHMFREAYRVLRPGGLFRIICPDIDLYHRAYLAGDASFFPYPELQKTYSLEQLFLHELATMLSEAEKRHGTKKLSDEYVREVFRTNADYRVALDLICSHIDFSQNRDIPNHVSWWNYDKVFESLRNAQFTRYYRSAYRQSASPALRDTAFFDGTLPPYSLYVEAIR